MASVGTKLCDESLKNTDVSMLALTGWWHSVLQIVLSLLSHISYYFLHFIFWSKFFVSILCVSWHCAFICFATSGILSGITTVVFIHCCFQVVPMHLCFIKIFSFVLFLWSGTSIFMVTWKLGAMMQYSAHAQIQKLEVSSLPDRQLFSFSSDNQACL